MPLVNRSAVMLVARRQLRLLRRARTAGAALALLVGAAWLPPLLMSLRTGTIGLASLTDVAPLALATSGVVLPLLALLAGADLLAGEMEDGSLIPVVTLPISRPACYAGKALGLGALFSAAYVAAFGSAAVAMVVAAGSLGLADYIAVAAAGLLLSLCCMGIGTALAAAGRGRVRAYAAALAMWMLFVFVIDAALLTAVVALAPSPPAQVGRHGHDELVVAPQDGSAETTAGASSAGADTLSAWLLLLDPVDLFRLSAMQAGPRLRAQWEVAGVPSGGSLSWLRLLIGWLAWALLPVAYGLRRFRRATLA